MNYSEMSDYDINEACAKIVGKEAGGYFCPCWEWADAGPIILANKIGVSPYAELWEAETGRLDIDCPNFISDNPLRAAMIVFLMMQEGR